MDLNTLRKAFPHTDRVIYMNHAALSPISVPVKEAISAYLEERHLTNIENFFEFQPTITQARQRAAEILNAGESEIAFTSNTSTGLNILAQGLDWRAGDRILIPQCEFPANVYPFLQLEPDEVFVDFLPDREGTYLLEDIESAIQPDTRLLSLSWVQFLSGYRSDLKAIGALCKEKGILFCVDAIQGLGALQVDVKDCNIDFLASGGHKWLMATQGIGVVYAKQELLKQLKPAAGWLNVRVDWERLTDYDMVFYSDGRRFRAGTENAPGIASLNAALGLYLEADPAWCEQQVLLNARKLAAGLAELGFERYGKTSSAHDSGIVTVKHSNAAALYEALKSRSIHLAVRNGLLRFAPTYYNTAEEVDIVLTEIKKLLSEYPV